MKVTFFLSLCLLGSYCGFLFAQADTEIYALSLQVTDADFSFGTPKNISNNNGYDSQPSFFDATALLFSSTRNGQTDIAQYSFKDETKSWLSSTAVGSEYSPLLIPGDQAISAIRLDTTGLQRLYRYPLSSEKPELLFDKAKIGYHVWVNSTQLLATVLVEDRMDLSLANTEEDTLVTVFQDVGRSLNRIPNSSKVSFVQSKGEKSTVYAIDPSNKKIEKLIALDVPILDMYWFEKNIFLYSTGINIHSVDVVTGETKLFYQSQLEAVKRITRILVSPDKTRLIFVGE